MSAKTHLNNLLVGNFKCFGAESINEPIPLAPFTLVYGENSSGKTSLMESIRLLSFLVKDGARSIVPRMHGRGMDFGTWERLVHNYNPNIQASVEIGAGFSTSTNPIDIQFELCQIEIGEGKDNSIIYDPRGAICAEIKMRNSNGDTWRFGNSLFTDSESGYLNEQDSWIPDEFVLEEVPLLIPVENSLTSHVLRQLNSDQRNLKAPMTRINLGVNQLVDSPFQDLEALIRHTISENNSFSTEDVSSIYNNCENILGIPLSSAISNSLHKLSKYLDDLEYLGPLREQPRRNYPMDQDANTIGSKGQFAHMFVHAGSQRAVFLQNMFDHLLPGHEIFFEETKTKEHDSVNTWRIKFPNNNNLLTLADVGFGFSQLIPILVASSNPDTSILLIEQPELHLHPKLQGDLLQLLVDRTGTDDGPAQMLVETHSEAMLLRLQRMLLRGEIEPDKVQLSIVEKITEGNRQRSKVTSYRGKDVEKCPLFETFSSLRTDELWA